MALTQADLMQNGYFYTFIYKAKDDSLDVDESPVIYCIGPSLKNENNFIGLNLHKLPEQLRESLILGMQRRKGILDSNSRAIFSENELNAIVPGAKAAIREYNRKRVYYPLRIDSTDIILYLYDDGKQRIRNNKGLVDFILRRWKAFLNK
jgi:hypothetical protein